jgi:hypothetical protein
MGGACSADEVGKGVYRVFGEENRPLGKPRPRWEDNITMNLQELGVRTGYNWLTIWTGEQALVNAVMNIRVP